MASAAGLNAEITASGSIFPVSSEAQPVYEPSAVMAKDGRTIIAWSGYDTALLSYDVKARIYSPKGTALTDTFIVHRSTSGYQRSPLVSASEEGRFLVAWYGDGDSGMGHYFRTFDREGNPLSGEVYGASFREKFSAAVIDNNSLVAVSATDTLIRVKKYSLDGVETGYTQSISTSGVMEVAVKASPSGAFALLYLKGTSGSTGKTKVKTAPTTCDAMMTYFNSAGIPGADIPVKTGYTGVMPDMGINGDGALIVVTAGTDGFTASTFGMAGELLEAEKPVLAYPADMVNLAAALKVSMNREGFYTLSWIQANTDGSRSLMTALFEYNGTVVEGSMKVFGSPNIFEAASGLSDRYLVNVWYSSDDTENIYASFLTSRKLVPVSEPADLIPIIKQMIMEKKIKRWGGGRRIIHGLKAAQRCIDRGRLRAAKVILRGIERSVSRKARRGRIESAAASELMEYLRGVISGI